MFRNGVNCNGEDGFIYVSSFLPPFRVWVIGAVVLWIKKEKTAIYCSCSVLAVGKHTKEAFHKNFYFVPLETPFKWGLWIKRETFWPTNLTVKERCSTELW